eukprot:scaffold2911_cov414-Prasinococcus_capsulatus_cf.AAC.61
MATTATDGNKNQSMLKVPEGGPPSQADYAQWAAAMVRPTPAAFARANRCHGVPELPKLTLLACGVSSSNRPTTTAAARSSSRTRRPHRHHIRSRSAGGRSILTEGLLPTPR